jgi:hypothetical protein
MRARTLTAQGLGGSARQFTIFKAAIRTGQLLAVFGRFNMVAVRPTTAGRTSQQQTFNESR